MTKDNNLEVLIVEDTEKNLASVPLIREIGYTVDVAKTLCEAFEKMDTKKYDVILTDLMFPIGYGDASECIRSGQNEVQPLGYSIMLYAAQKKVPRVAMLTDMNHHQSPIAATFDYLGQGRQYKIDDTQIRLYDTKDIHAKSISKPMYLDTVTNQLIDCENYSKTSSKIAELYSERTGTHSDKISQSMVENMFIPVKNWPIVLQKALEMQ